jgi:hypothetical protein
VCTLVYLPWDGEAYGAVIGLNRDEVYGRASAPPRWWPADGKGVGFVAPVDLVAGGTWFGVNENGLFVALTNGRQVGEFRHERSRGELVGAALRRESIEEAVTELTGRDGLAYAPCHLLLAQRRRVAYVAPDERGRFTTGDLDDAPHTLTNEGLDLGDTPPLPELTADASEPAVVGGLRAMLATHHGPNARCRHGADRGTVSSAVLLLGDTLANSRLHFAPGPPCVTKYGQVVDNRHRVAEHGE